MIVYDTIWSYINGVGRLIIRGAHIHIFVFCTINPFEIDCFEIDLFQIGIAIQLLKENLFARCQCFLSVLSSSALLKIGMTKRFVWLLEQEIFLEQKRIHISGSAGYSRIRYRVAACLPST